MKLYTYAIKNSLGQTVEPRYASPHLDPDEAVRDYLRAFTSDSEAVSSYLSAPVIFDPEDTLHVSSGWHAVPVLTGEIVKWRDGSVTHFAEVIDDVGTMVRVAFGDETRLVKISEVEIVPSELQFAEIHWSLSPVGVLELGVPTPSEVPAKVKTLLITENPDYEDFRAAHTLIGIHGDVFRYHKDRGVAIFMLDTYPVSELDAHVTACLKELPAR